MLSLFQVFMSPTVSVNVANTLNSGMITQSSKVEEYENKLKEWFNYPFILSLNSATSGLTIAIRMLDLSPDDEVLSTPLTCTATNWPILANNAKIKWVDVDINTCNMDLDDLKSKITNKTKAVVLVHWGGSPINLEKLSSIQTYTLDTFGFKLKVIEDCAHAFGAEYKGKKIGTHGNTCVFSTQAIKHLTTGDGGLIFCEDEKSYQRAKLLRWYGISREQRSSGKDFRLENDINEWGYKFHMNDINATIGIYNLPYIAKNLQRIRENTDFYDKELASIKCVELLKKIPDSLSAYWIYTIKIKCKEDFITFMKDHGIMVSQVHNRNDIHSCVKQFKCHLPLLDKLEKEIICIPCGWWITDQDRLKIVDCIKNFSSLI